MTGNTPLVFTPRPLWKRFLLSLPGIGWAIRRWRDSLARSRFDGSAHYWTRRYERGGDSGSGSHGALAAFKAEVLNGFVEEEGVKSVIEFGCGDGNQLTLARYDQYLGIDISPEAVARCRRLFANDSSKRFVLLAEYVNETAELALSLDVVFHLVEDSVYEDYLERLFKSAERFVAIYSSNDDDNTRQFGSHVRHRQFTSWIETRRPEWHLLRRIPNRFPFDAATGAGSFADFYLFHRRRPSDRTSSDFPELLSV